MKIQHTLTLAEDLSKVHLLLDSTTLINASKSTDFLELLKSIRAAGCTLVTIPPVIYEFTRWADKPERVKELKEFIEALKIDVIPKVEEMILKQSEIFTLIYNNQFKEREKKKPSYTDSLLCAMMYKHRNSDMRLITANFKDIPRGLFDRVDVITMERGNELFTEGIYTFSLDRFNKELLALD